MRHLLVLEIRQFLIRARRFHNREQIVAAHFITDAFGGEWNGASHIHGKSRRPRREARKVQTTRAHRFNFRRVGLHGIIDDALADAFFEMVGEWFEDIGIDGGIFDRRIGPDEGGRITPFLRVRRRIRHVSSPLVMYR